MRSRATTARRKGAGATKNPVDTGEAAGDEAGLLEISMEPLYPQAKLEMSLADDIQNAPRESVRAMTWSPGAVHQGLPVVALPGDPPAREGRIGNIRYPAEGAGAKSRILTARLLERGDVSGSCLDGPRCASFVHVGPPVGYLDLLFP
jgi:hypothetical protein